MKFIVIGKGENVKKAWKNYGDWLWQPQGIKGKETGINIDTRFMKIEIHWG